MFIEGVNIVLARMLALYLVGSVPVVNVLLWEKRRGEIPQEHVVVGAPHFHLLLLVWLLLPRVPAA